MVQTGTAGQEAVASQEKSRDKAGPHSRPTSLPSTPNTSQKGAVGPWVGGYRELGLGCYLACHTESAFTRTDYLPICPTPCFTDEDTEAQTG